MNRARCWPIAFAAILAGGLNVGAASAQTRSLEQMVIIAQHPQTFYPIHRAHLTGEDAGGAWDFYVMPEISGKSGRGQTGAAVFINVTLDNGVRLQFVELAAISCTSGTIAPAFRIAWNAEGELLRSTGPTKTQEPSETLLTPQAVKETARILCTGVVPKNALFERKLSDFR